MAYRAFDEWQHAAATEPLRLPSVARPALVAPAPAPAFTAVELSVIGLARVDGLATLRPRNWLTRLAERLFGLGRPNQLADPRLEALRRFALIVRNHRGDPPQGEINRFLAAGFSARAAIALSSLAS